MKCPNNHESFQEIKIGNVKVDYCSECKGLWFNQDELRQAKDLQDEYAKWFDFDLWDNEKNFKSTQSLRLCPVDHVPMFKIKYKDSTVEIDACKKCLGVWLDKDEFKNIVEFVKGRSAYDLLHNYTKSVIEEGKEIFTGPESLKSEVSDFLMIVKLFQFKVFANSALTQFLMGLPFTK
ncbi:MAG: hypothetical protein UV65_C0018G0006 [Parcubacteria group bacterium GW2011_GWF2_43_11]|nr:MAG: hypothetical protein UV65_C0018G0006 [Parcubacteria group bacterium GW2011_GWF2_43_11]